MSERYTVCGYNPQKKEFHGVPAFRTNDLESARRYGGKESENGRVAIVCDLLIPEIDTVYINGFLIQTFKS